MNQNVHEDLSARIYLWPMFLHKGLPEIGLVYLFNLSIHKVRKLERWAVHS